MSTDADPELLELFRTEVEEHIAVLQEAIVALDAGGDAAQHLGSCMRAAHSLKGAARIVGLEAGVKLAHAMEDAFEAARQGNLTLGPEDIDRLLEAGDYLAELGRKDFEALGPWLDSEADAITALIEQLESAGQAAPAAAKEPPPAGPPVVEPAPPPSIEPAPQPRAPAEQAVEPPAPSEDTAPAASTAAADGGDDAEARQLQSVKVSTEVLARFMGASAQVLIDARRLQSTADALQRVRRGLAGLEKRLGGDTEPETIDAEFRRELSLLRDDLGDRVDDFEVQTGRALVNAEMLYDEVLRSRMRPFSDVAVNLPRLVRDVARQLGKKVHLKIVGRATELDRDVAAVIEAPLGHLLRNAIDHGLEAPEERQAAGKDETGTIVIEARHRAGMLEIAVRDDGRGIDVERLRRAIVDKGLIDAPLAASLSEPEALEFLFLPGFSTAGRVTDISGRGVGLDVVQSTVQRAGGVVQVSTTLGKGTAMELQLPVARSVVRALIVSVGGEPWALPLARIDAIRQLPADAARSVEGRRVAEIDGHDVGVVPLSEVLELDVPGSSADPSTIVVIHQQEHRFGLEVDAVVSEQELVVRPLDQRLGKVPDVLASSQMDNGTAVLILDVDDLLRSVDTLLAEGRLRTSRRSPVESARRTRHILVVDDSLTVRETERKLLERAGYLVDVAVDGVAGWNALRLGSYDLLLTDVDMPRMTGIDLIRRVRDDTRLRDLPVMIVSYKEREEDRRAGLEAGADRYITKASFRDEGLLLAVGDLIGGPLTD
ncbi:MAG: response regulator [Alphaproteobacteria bacterium]|nr:response regulator [Alphaproteobacteria bacterium]